jgi:hypothetical protein
LKQATGDAPPRELDETFEKIDRGGTCSMVYKESLNGYAPLDRYLEMVNGYFRGQLDTLGKK